MKKEYDFSKLEKVKNPYPGKKKAVGINLSPEVVDYFKGLADETGLPYQKLIDLYLLDCAKKRKKLTMKWRRRIFAETNGEHSLLICHGCLAFVRVLFLG